MREREEKRHNNEEIRESSAHKAHTICVWPGNWSEVSREHSDEPANAIKSFGMCWHGKQECSFKLRPNLIELSELKSARCVIAPYLPKLLQPANGVLLYISVSI